MIIKINPLIFEIYVKDNIKLLERSVVKRRHILPNLLFSQHKYKQVTIPLTTFNNLSHQQSTKRKQQLKAQ